METIIRLHKDDREKQQALELSLAYASAIKNSQERAKKLFRDSYNRGGQLPEHVSVGKAKTSTFIGDQERAIQGMKALGLEPKQIAETLTISTTKIVAILIRDKGYTEEEARLKVNETLNEYGALEESTSMQSVTYRK